MLVEHEGAAVVREAHGYANRSDLLPNETGTRFGIASGCKIFTSVCVYQLIEQGFLNLESAIGDVLDASLGRIDPAVTVGQLLTHTSGVPDYFDEEETDDYASIWVNQPVYTLRSPWDFLPLFRDKEMCFHPGDRFKYSNSGYIVLGMVVESVTGRPFHEFVTENVLQKSNMADSGYFRLDNLPPKIALGYTDEAGGTWKSNIYSIPFIGGADGGAFVTAEDMLKFWTALFDHRLLSAGATLDLLAPHAKVNDKTSYGYGVWLGVNAGARAAADVGAGTGDGPNTGAEAIAMGGRAPIRKFSVVGGDPGVSFSSAVYPQAGLRTVVLANQDDAAHLIARRIDSLIG